MELFLINSDHLFWDLTAQTAQFIVQVLILWYLIKIHTRMKDKD